MPRYTTNTVEDFHVVFDSEKMYDVFVTNQKQRARDVLNELTLGVALEDVLMKYDNRGFPEAAKLVSTGEAVLP